MLVSAICFVVPAQAGIQWVWFVANALEALDPSLRGDDELK